MKKFNVLYMMSDDHAYNAISAYGSILSQVFKTPSIDRLGEEGIRLDACYSTNAICTPARATIMSGQYGNVNGVKTLADAWDPNNGVNLARIFQDAGYQTSLFGKWHLHCTPEGFDEYKILSAQHGQGTYQNPAFTEKYDGETQYQGYVTDIITDMAVTYLKKDVDREKPFFMMCQHKAPHDFWEFAERHAHMFDGVEIPMPDSIYEDKSHRSEGSKMFGSSVSPRSKVRSLYEDFQQEDYPTGKLVIPEDATFEEKTELTYQKYLKDYLRTVAGIDDSVKTLLDTLEEIGELDNTLIIYTSDQGMYLGEHDYQDKRWGFEEGLKIPFLMRCPGLIPVAKGNDNLMANIDIAPTLLDLCGLEVPEEMQGISQKSVLTQEGQEDIRESVYFRYWMHLAHRHDNPAHLGIRTKKYKLFYFYGHPLDSNGAEKEITPQAFELYDLTKDPYELHNVYEDEAYQEVLCEMKQKLREAKAYYKDYDEGFEDIIRI